MKMISLILCIGMALPAAGVLATGTTSQYDDIITSSGLTVQDFEHAANLYKHLTEHEHQNHYRDEYKFALAAAKLGSAEAMLWLGEMYQGGAVPNVPPDEAVKQAFHWWNNAFHRGQPRGYTDIALVYMHQPVPGGGSNFTGIAVNEKKAIQMLDMAVNAGDMKAPRILGLLYEKGDGMIKPDPQKSLAYFIQAYQRGDSTGAVYYADALLKGQQTRQNVAKAIGIYQHIVDSHDHDMALCSYKLGEMYQHGEYVKADHNKAVHYLKVAADNGNERARIELSKLLK